MTSVFPDVTEPIPLVLGDSGYPTGVLFSPVFVEGGARRRRLLARWGYLATAACLAYLAMLGVSITASPVSKPGDAAKKPVPSVTGAGAPTTPAPRPARADPLAVPSVQIPATTSLADGDAAQDAPLLLRLALPATMGPAPPKPAGTTRPTPTSRAHRDNDKPPITHAPPISTTAAASSKTTSPTPPSKRATR